MTVFHQAAAYYRPESYSDLIDTCLAAPSVDQGATGH